jgi:hypothetical protein
VDYDDDTYTIISRRKTNGWHKYYHNRPMADFILSFDTLIRSSNDEAYSGVIIKRIDVSIYFYFGIKQPEGSFGFYRATTRYDNPTQIEYVVHRAINRGYNQWNSIRIEVTSEQLIAICNDTEIMRIEHEGLKTKGHIGLCTFGKYGDEVSYRNPYIEREG